MAGPVARLWWCVDPGKHTHRHIEPTSTEGGKRRSGVACRLCCRCRCSLLDAGQQKSLHARATPQRSLCHLPRLGQLSRLQLGKPPEGVHIAAGRLQLRVVGGCVCAALRLKLGDQGSQAVLQGAYLGTPLLHLLDLVMVDNVYTSAAQATHDMGESTGE